jgi:hypothetical protein
VGWARGLKKAGYATDPTYADRLIKIIEDFKLYLFDEYGDNRQLALLQHEPAPTKAPSARLVRPSASHKIEMRNGLRSIVVGPGDTYDSLTKELGMKNWELSTYNDFSKGREPKENEILYTEAKNKKADRRHKRYVAEEDDTMHYISQKFALKLKPLLKRNRMKYGDEPEAGQVIYLRKKKPRKG